MLAQVSQSTIKMEKGYYYLFRLAREEAPNVAIHNKNGKGLLPSTVFEGADFYDVAIHNKNGKGLLPIYTHCITTS